MDRDVLPASSVPPTVRRPPLRVAAVDSVNGVSGRVFQGDVVSWRPDVALSTSVSMSTQRADFVDFFSTLPPKRKPHPLMVTDDVRQYG